MQVEFSSSAGAVAALVFWPVIPVLGWGRLSLLAVRNTSCGRGAGR